MLEGDAGVESNFYRDVLMREWWARDAGRAPLFALRAVEKHYVVVADPAAAAAVLSGAAQLDKMTEPMRGFDLVASARGARSALTLSSFSAEWKLLRKAVLPAFSLSAVRRRFDREIRPDAEAGADAIVRIWRAKMAAEDADSADAAASAAASSPRRTTAVSVDVAKLAASLAMDITTSFAFGIRSNTVERWGAAEASKILTAAVAKQQQDSDDGGPVLLPAPPAVPPHLIEGAADTIECLAEAFAVVQQYIAKPYLSYGPFSWTKQVREGKKTMRAIQSCFAAVVAAAGAAADAREAARAARAAAVAAKSSAASATSAAVSAAEEEEMKEDKDETVFDRLRAVAPEAAAAAAADALAAGGSAADAEGAAEIVLRESGLIYAAGIDTSGYTLSVTLAFLAAHPEAMRRVERELESRGLLTLRGDGGAGKIRVPRRLEFADLSRSSLPFLHACLDESMRLVPAAAAGTMRTVGPGGYQLTVPDWREEEGGGEEEEKGEGRKRQGENKTNTMSKPLRTVVIPEGCQLWVSFCLLHRSEEIWGPDAAEFKPERFLEPAAAPSASAADAASASPTASTSAEEGAAEAASAAAASAARLLMPFSLGARGCIGQNLARNSMIAELATLLGRLSFSLDRSRMGGSLLPAERETADGVRGAGDAVFEREGCNFTMAVKGGVWLLATPRGEDAGAGVGGDVPAAEE
jgi:cytochrome P450